jgi:hypothetical protein
MQGRSEDQGGRCDAASDTDTNTLKGEDEKLE